MSVKELIVNAGSSSLKYTVFLMPEEEVLCNGIFEQLGTPLPTFTHKLPNESGKLTKVIDKMALTPGADHSAAITTLIETLTGKEFGVLESMDEIAAVGHRVLHGGEKFSGSVLVNEAVKEAIRECIPLGPLHNPANLMGIEVCEKIMKGIPQVAVFDTAFHQTIPEEAYMYALPYKYYKEYGIRRYGFHGTSHRYISKRTAEFLCSKYPGKYDPETLRIVTCHLGNGSSISAVLNGKCYDTSMGLTPLDGLLMGTRCGSIDPEVVCYIMNKEGLTPSQMSTLIKIAEDFAQGQLAIKPQANTLAEHLRSISDVLDYPYDRPSNILFAITQHFMESPCYDLFYIVYALDECTQEASRLFSTKTSDYNNFMSKYKWLRNRPAGYTITTLRSYVYDAKTFGDRLLTLYDNILAVTDKHAGDQQTNQELFEKVKKWNDVAIKFADGTGRYDFYYHRALELYDDAYARKLKNDDALERYNDFVSTVRAERAEIKKMIDYVYSIKI